MTQSEPVALPEPAYLADRNTECAYAAVRVKEWSERNKAGVDIPLYTEKQMHEFRNQRTPAVALSDEEIAEISYACANTAGPRIDHFKFARALLARATERGQA